MTDNQITLRFEVPGKSAPGYLRRMRQALEFQQALSSDVAPETLDKLVEYLTQFVIEPTDKAAKVEALWMASQDEFVAMLTAITSGGDEPDPTPPPPTS